MEIKPIKITYSKDSNYSYIEYKIKERGKYKDETITIQGNIFKNGEDRTEYKMIEFIRNYKKGGSA